MFYLFGVWFMLNKIESWFKRYFDYRIVGEYYDTDGDGHYYKKYKKKYYWKGVKKSKR